jgi:hypothetical protein
MIIFFYFGRSDGNNGSASMGFIDRKQVYIANYIQDDRQPPGVF